MFRTDLRTSFVDERDLAVINYLLAKKQRNNGKVVGYHGTSKARAKEIDQKGFTNYPCVEGIYGVHFHDDGHESNAHLHGQDKARQDKCTEYSVIKAELDNPAPDLLMGRPQWHTTADKIKILEIRHYLLKTEDVST